MRRMKTIALCLILMITLVMPGVVLATEPTTPEVTLQKEVGTAEALLEAVKTSGTVTLTENIDLKTALRIETGVNVILNLNGKTLSLPALNNYAATVKGDLTITGNGTVNATGEYGIVAFGGNLTIKNGTFNGPEATYLIADYGGKIVIEDGTFNAKKYVVNGLVEQTVNPVEIKNGTFNTSTADRGNVLGNVEISKGQFNSIIRGELLAENAEITIKLEHDNDLSNLWRPDTLTESIVISNGAKVTLDLNGHNITSPVRAFIVDGADFTVKGEGKISVTDSADAAIAVKGSKYANDETYTTVNIEKGVVLEGLYGLFVTSVDNAYAYAVEVNFNGQTTYGGIYTNGNIQHTENCPVINIGSDANITERGIYAAGYAEWNIDGATISGIGHGIGIKSGKFNIKNAKIIGTGLDSRPTDGYNNGMNNSGSAIQIESNKGYAGKIDINVENSILESKNGVAFYEYLATFEDESKSATTTAVNSLKISGTEFKAKVADFDVSTSFKSTITKFINSGKFTTDVKEYIADGLVCNKADDLYVVSKEHTITIKGAEGGKVIIRDANTKAELTKAIYGTIVEIVAEPNEEYIFKGFTGVEGLEEVAENAYQFKMPETNVEITAEFEKLPVEELPTQEVVVPENIANQEKTEEMLVETLKELAKNDPDLADVLENNNVKIEVKVDDKKEVAEEEKKDIEEAANKKVADLKVAKYLDITIAVVNKDDGKLIDNLEKVKEEITFTVAIPQEILDDKVEEGYVRKYFVIRDHNGTVDVWEVEAKDGKVEFSSNLFSTYAIAYKDVPTSEELPGESEDDKKEEEKLEDNSNNPSTGDNIVLYVVILVVAVAGIVTVSILKKRNNTKK